MGMTMTQKILAAHCGQEHVKAGQLIEANLDIVLGNDTGASWLCYYRALQSGPASVVVPIDKLSILVTVAFSRLVFQERLTSRSAAGLALIVAGTLAMLF